MSKGRSDNLRDGSAGRRPKGHGQRRPAWYRIAAALCAAAIALAQCVLLWPAFVQEASAETAGQTLSVRVQYFGERGDMIREKARFSRSDLEAIAAESGIQTCYYSNITNVGDVMSMAAYGPAVTDIIAASGIELDSVNYVTFRTTDNYSGYTKDFTIDQHLTEGNRFFYPYLSSLYSSGENGTLIPKEGALADAQPVPSILALRFAEKKGKYVYAPDLTDLMETKKTYRFCMGQTPLNEGVQTRAGYGGGDVSSMDSVHSIYGIDVTLAGSPVTGIGIDPVDSKLKVGSVTKLQISIAGDELFAEDFGKAIGKLKWKSSDPSIAKVDKNGNVTILKAGTVTITVTAENGMSASVTINGTGKAKRSEQKAQASRETTQATAAQKASSEDKKQTTRTTAKAPEQTRATVHLRELSLGGRVDETKPQEQSVSQHAMEENEAALKEQDTHHQGTAAGASAAALAAAGAGGIIRFRRYRTILKGWKR